MAARVLMLGWEFPPFITGGLGTACHGLTRALSSAGAHVTFVLPRSVDPSASTHVQLLSPEAELAAPVAGPPLPSAAPPVAAASPLVAIVSPSRSVPPAAHVHEPVHSAALLAQGTPERVSFLGIGAAASAWPSVYSTAGGAPAATRGTPHLESWRHALARLQWAIAASSDPVA